MDTMTGRFDRSFVIRMIRDFLLALTAIVILELGGRFALEWYHFRHQDQEATALAAERLAADVKNIMLNQGGPVAARTFYPILRRNHQNLGFEIAIEPSDSTVAAIERNFGYQPSGIPPEWSTGRHHEVTVAIPADEFCTTCHSNLRPGDVVGHVVVRRYQATRFDLWWQEVRVISVMGMANVILHSIVLFFLLRLRMEPLLRLRSMLSRMAKGTFDLSQRAEAKSDDEFGELATDLNHFLDRLCHVVEDLDSILGKVGAANQRLGQVSGTMTHHIDDVRSVARQALRQLIAAQGETMKWARETSDGDRVLQQLEELSDLLNDLAGHLDDDTHYLSEIHVLEDHMKTVAESGQLVLDRLKS
jgi:hypothetical protein